MKGSGLDILVSPVACCPYIGVFLVDKRVCSMRVSVGERIVTVVCEYPAFLEVLVLEDMPPETLSSFKLEAVCA